MTNRRFESISGILNRTATDTAADLGTAEQPRDQSHAAADPAPASVTTLRPATPDAGRPAQSLADASPKASTTSDGGVRRIAFRLDPTLHTALAAKAASDKASQGQVVLDAIEAAHQTDALTNLIAAEAAAPQSDSLFPRLRGRGTAQATVPVEIRLHAQAATVLDQLVTQTGAESRTQLIAAALRRHLS